MSDPQTALAVPFTWTPDGTYDLRLAFAAGASPVDVTVPAATYRCNLAPTTGSVTDFLRKLASRADTALAAAGRAETVTAAITSAGLVTFTLSTGTATWTVTSDLQAALGLGSSSFGPVASIGGTYPPRGLLLFCGSETGLERREEPIAGGFTVAGGVFAVRSSIVTHTMTLELPFLPSTDVERFAQGVSWSPWRLGYGTSAPPWPVETAITGALGQECAFARFWQSVRASTSEPFDVVQLDPAALATPDAGYQFPDLTSFVRLRLPVIRTEQKTRT
ncbi:MAG TPA: hypothetical protein VFV33_20415 [Gemmatimonadaceae bacterium]|nr:hypothetical protein [Gemmatimonadaceae bacterium]